VIVSVKVVGMVAGGRQHIVAHTQTGDPILLLPEPDNAYDSHAIAVHTAPRDVLVGEVVSSIKDEQHVGSLDDDDRRLLIDRQAGYLPATVAAKFTLPPEGVVGYVSALRWAPARYDSAGREREPRVAGFDATFWRPDDARHEAAKAQLDTELDTMETT